MKRKKLSEHQDPKKEPMDPGAAQAWFMVFVVLLVVGLSTFVDYQRRKNHNPFVNPPVGRFRGPTDADYKIVQFFDFLVPDCYRGQEKISSFMAQYPEDVFTEVRFFPYDDQAISAAVFAECMARQQKFGPFMRILSERYFQWAELPASTAIFKEIAADLKADMKALNQCAQSEEASATVLYDRAYGEAQMIRSVPAYLMNGRLYVGNDRLEKVLARWDEELSR